ncbi:MAG: hypothetical protein AAF512_17900, partial [Pseudomonadota bacterium]
MTDTISTIGWNDKSKEAPEVIKLRAHLEANNGIQGLEILKSNELEQIVKSFRRDGFVVVGDILNDEQVDILASGCHEVIDEIIALDSQHQGNRGSHRYSFGGSSLTRSQL